MSSQATAVSTRTVDDLLLVRAVEEFLYAEAELLDNRRFEDWLALLADDIRYWMPMRRNVRHDHEDQENTREQADMNWFDESKDVLTKRVEQLRTGVHWAEEPLSRVCHLVSNVQLTSVTPREVTLKCRFIVYRNRLQDETDFFVGKREDTLRRMGDGFRISRRKITLDQNVLLAKNLSIFF